MVHKQVHNDSCFIIDFRGPHETLYTRFEEVIVIILHIKF